MRIRRIISVALIIAMAPGLFACRATERYMRAQESAIESAIKSEPLVCDKTFGNYRFNPGWVEIEQESKDPDFYTYSGREYIDSAKRPYTLTVSCDTNDYAPDNYNKFCSDRYQSLTDKYGADKVVYDHTYITDNNYGTTQVTFEYFSEDTHFYQWHVFGSIYHVTFELIVNDEEIALQNEAADTAFTAACSLRFK